MMLMNSMYPTGPLDNRSIVSGLNAFELMVATLTNFVHCLIVCRYFGKSYWVFGVSGLLPVRLAVG